jgi:TRAP-type C4-dicarboxylate transport system permease small subunit
VHRDKLTKVLEGFCIFVFTILVLCVIAQVLTRYVFHIALPWTEEVARVLYIWVVFFGMVVVESENRGIRTTYFLTRMNPIARMVVLTIMQIASIIFCLVFLYGSIIMAIESWTMQIGSFKWMTGAVIYMPSCVAPLLMVYYLIKQQIRIFQTGGEVAEEGAE